MQLTHQYLPPRSGQTRNLVVLLHGFGSSGSDILGLGRSLSAALPDVGFVAPDAPDPVPGMSGGHMWFSIPELDGSSTKEADTRLQASAERLHAFLDQQLVDHGINPSALALVGFSQGAGMCYEVGPRRTMQLAGVVAISGRMKRRESLSSEVRTTPPFLILGGANDTLLSESESQLTTTALSQAGIPNIRKSMANTGHGISEEGLITVGSFLCDVFGKGL